MRRAAKITGKKFGIHNFSHSTISRAFSRMAQNSTILETLLHDKDLPDTTKDIALPGKPGCIVSPLCSDSKKKAAPFLFSVLAPILEITYKESLIVYEHFMKYCCLLPKKIQEPSTNSILYISLHHVLCYHVSMEGGAS